MTENQGLLANTGLPGKWLLKLCEWVCMCRQISKGIKHRLHFAISW